MSATPDRPNIILITTDQQRWDAMGLNCPGTPLQTPTLDHLASSGVNFRRGYSTCPVCIPARRSLLTGLHPRTHGLRGYRDGLDWNPSFTMPGLLGAQGYQTQLIGKLHLHPQRKRYGFDHMIRVESPNDRWDTPLQPTNDWIDWMKERGYDHPNDIGINGNGRVARPWDKEERLHLTSWTADRAVDFITTYRDPSTPFFLHLSFWAPHPPLIPPQAYWDRYIDRHDWTPCQSDWTPRFDDIPRGIADDAAVGPFSATDMHAAAAGYFGLVNHIDDRIRYVLTRMFEYGSPRAKEPTLILYSSDHGEMLGDHQLWRKSLPYEASNHVPYFISWRNLDLQAGTCDELVSLEDLVATGLDAAGVPLPEPLGDSADRLDGISLMPTLRGEAQTVRERLHSECTGSGAHQCLIQGDWKYIWFAKTNEEQLFNLTEDPRELTDRSAETERLEPFRRSMAAYLAERDDYDYDLARLQPCANRSPAVFWNPN